MRSLLSCLLYSRISPICYSNRRVLQSLREPLDLLARPLTRWIFCLVLDASIMAGVPLPARVASAPATPAAKTLSVVHHMLSHWLSGNDGRKLFTLKGNCRPLKN